MEAIRSSETSVHTRCTQRQIPEDGILHRHHCENFKSYVRKQYCLNNSNWFEALGYLLKCVCCFVEISSSENLKRCRHTVMNSETSRLKNMPSWTDFRRLHVLHLTLVSEFSEWTSSECCTITFPGQISLTIQYERYAPEKLFCKLSLISLIDPVYI
jgi:hypothetical protein